VAAAPRATKTVEKPRTKARLVIPTRRARPAGVPPSLRRATLIPLMNERYPGTIGSTQGETNEITPARNAVTRDIGSVIARAPA